MKIFWLMNFQQMEEPNSRWLGKKKKKLFIKGKGSLSLGRRRRREKGVERMKGQKEGGGKRKGWIYFFFWILHEEHEKKKLIHLFYANSKSLWIFISVVSLFPFFSRILLSLLLLFPIVPDSRFLFVIFRNVYTCQRIFLSTEFIWFFR